MRRAMWDGMPTSLAPRNKSKEDATPQDDSSLMETYKVVSHHEAISTRPRRWAQSQSDLSNPVLSHQGNVRLGTWSEAGFQFAFSIRRIAINCTWRHFGGSHSFYFWHATCCLIIPSTMASPVVMDGLSSRCHSYPVDLHSRTLRPRYIPCRYATLQALLISPSGLETSAACRCHHCACKAA